jgi:hypothetical protein
MWTQDCLSLAFSLQTLIGCWCAYVLAKTATR